MINGEGGGGGGRRRLGRVWETLVVVALVLAFVAVAGVGLLTVRRIWTATDVADPAATGADSPEV